MANPEHLAILKQGVEVWNKWREENPDVVPDLSYSCLNEANLTKADLRNAYLRSADLRAANFYLSVLDKADLTEADLSWAILSRADLVQTRLSSAILSDADLRDAELRWTDVTWAELNRANLMWADLFNADFTNSECSATVFADVDLSETKGLESVRHLGPSTIGIDTIIKSKGKIPEVFLRGCGVPDEFIDYIPSLLSQPFNYYSCFISHSSLDKEFCARLYNDLRGAHVRTWYFPEDAKWGRSVWGEIDRSINIYDKLVLVCSRNSLQSGPVLREIERALNREDREGKHILFPITIDDYVFEEWQHPRKDDVLAKVVGDFRGWHTDVKQYNKSFKRLLDALNANE